MMVLFEEVLPDSRTNLKPNCSSKFCVLVIFYVVWFRGSPSECCKIHFAETLSKDQTGRAFTVRTVVGTGTQYEYQVDFVRET